MVFELYRDKAVAICAEQLDNKVALTFADARDNYASYHSIFLIPYADWGKFVDACERFYTEGGEK